MDSLAKQILTLFAEDKYYTKEKKEKIKNLIEGFIDNVKKLDNESISLDTSIDSLQKKTSSLSGLGEKTKQIRVHSLIKEAEEIKRCIMELANSKIRVSLKDSFILNLAVNLEQIFHKQLWNTRTETETETETEEEESASYNEKEKEKGPNEKDLLLEEIDKLKSKIGELEEDSDLEKVKRLSSNSDVKSKQKVWHYMKYKCDSLRTAIPTELYDNCDFWGLDFLEPTFDEDVKFVEDKLGHDFFVASLFCDQGSINDQGASQSSQSNLPAPQLYSGCSIACSLLKGSLGPVSQSENKYYGITSAHLSSGKNDTVFNYPEKTEVGEVHEYCKEHDFASFKIDDCYTSFDDIKSLQVFETFEKLESALKGGISLIRCSKDGELVLQVGENEKDKVVRLSKLEEFGTLGKEGSNLVLVIKLPLLDEFVTQNGCSGELLTMNDTFISLHKGMFPDLIDLEKRITEVKDEAKKKNYEKYFQKTKQGELPISLISVPSVTIQNKLSGHKFYKIKKPTPLTK